LTPLPTLVAQHTLGEEQMRSAPPGSLPHLMSFGVPGQPLDPPEEDVPDDPLDPPDDVPDDPPLEVPLDPPLDEAPDDPPDDAPLDEAPDDAPLEPEDDSPEDDSPEEVPLVPLDDAPAFGSLPKVEDSPEKSRSLSFAPLQATRAAEDTMAANAANRRGARGERDKADLISGRGCSRGGTRHWLCTTAWPRTGPSRGGSDRRRSRSDPRRSSTASRR